MLFRSPGKTLVETCKKGRLNKVKKLLESPVFQKISQKDIQQAYNYACYGGHEEIAVQLILYVADKERAFITAIDHALLNVVKKLVTSGMDTNINVGLGRRGVTPLRAAICDLNEKIIKFLLENGADINKADNMGSTSLHWLLAVSNVEEIHGCDNPEETRKEWDRASKRIAEILLDYGAELNAINSEGETPLDVAEGKENCLYEFMRQKGCKRSGELNSGN